MIVIVDPVVIVLGALVTVSGCSGTSPARRRGNG
jgi:hypothetical protein